MDIYKFISHQKELLECERNEELEQRKIQYSDTCLRLFQRLQGRGDAILNLKVSRPTESSTSLEGHSLLILSKQSLNLPSHRFTSGDNICIQNLQQQINNKQKTSSNNDITGVIYKVQRDKITIAVNNIPDEDDLGYKLYSSQSLVLIKLADDITYKRLLRVLDKLEQYENYTGKKIHEANTRLIEVLFYKRKPCFNKLEYNDIIYHNKNLNNSQKQAIKFCLNTSDIGLIHGPPGTGKTTTVVEFILQCVDKGLKVLACASSNIAVDNLVLGILPYIKIDKKKNPKPKIIRTGHPARMLPEVLNFSLEHILQGTNATSVVNDVANELQEKINSISKAKNKNAKSQIYKELRVLRKELFQRQRKAIRDLLKRIDILFSTSTGCDSKYLSLHSLVDEINGFDVIIIDEAAQSLEITSWIPILLGKKVILAGDHLQLPPTILSKQAAKGFNNMNGLEVTLFDRLIQQDKSISCLLNTQYRMNKEIMNWSSKALYNNELIAADIVENHLLSDLNHIKKNILTNVPLCIIDTCGELNEQKYEDDIEYSSFIELESKWNEGEAEIITNILNELIEYGVYQQDIGVITPYNAQVELLRTNIKYDDIEIGSVDGFQGREKEVILISTVRSNSEGDIGFLSEKRRMNVAITRARRLVILVCDSTTLCRDPFLKNMIEYFEENKNTLLMTHYDYLDQLKEEHYIIKHPKKNRDNIIQKSSINEKKSQKESNTISKKFSKEDIEQEKTKKHEITQQIKEFISNNDKDSLTFSPDLKSYFRKHIHEIAENNGLHHVTKQEGSNRVITISKIKKKEEIIKEELIKEETIKEKVLKKESIEQIQQTKKEVIPTQKKTINNTKKQKKKKQNINKQDKQSNPIPVLKGKQAKKNDEEDIDALIAELQSKKKKNSCYFGNCTRPTNIVTDKCKYCNAKYCDTHTMPEKHGCGDKIRKEKRDEWIQVNKGFKPLSEKDKDQKREEIRKKISSSSSKRKTKKGKNKKRR